MQDITSTPVSRVEAASAAVAVPSSGLVTAPVVTAPEQYAPDLPRPVTQRERIPTIDIVRGVALMGILVMNIGSFSGPFDMYMNPLSVGNHRSYDLIAWTIRWIFFEGKMQRGCLLSGREDIPFTGINPLPPPPTPAAFAPCCASPNS